MGGKGLGFLVLIVTIVYLPSHKVPQLSPLHFFVHFLSPFLMFCFMVLNLKFKVQDSKIWTLILFFGFFFSNLFVGLCFFKFHCYPNPCCCYYSATTPPPMVILFCCCCFIDIISSIIVVAFSNFRLSLSPFFLL
jgi:hypothetical protein